MRFDISSDINGICNCFQALKKVFFLIDYKALYLKAALRAGFILLCLFAVITVILVICIRLPEWLSRKDRQEGACRSGTRDDTPRQEVRDPDGTD